MMATEQIAEKTIIQKTPDVCGGDACIGNRRIPVWQLVECRNLGMNDERIMEVFDPPLTLADMEAAWQYYSENRHEIDEEIRLNAEAMQDEDE
jgi:uncharacterized protein (DUF433 family)